MLKIKKCCPKCGSDVSISDEIVDIDFENGIIKVQHRCTQRVTDTLHGFCNFVWFESFQVIRCQDSQGNDF